MTPTATYRLQFGSHLTFAEAEALVPYLAELGASHLYASPYLKARAGSTHGYDITDYSSLNPEIGDEAGLESLAEALHRCGMGQILDFVPNHMGIGLSGNAWWLDVLEWGPASPYAAYFDIDWAPAKANMRGKVLLPFLGDHYGAVLEKGELVLDFEAAAGRFVVRYHDHVFPIRPSTYRDIVGPVIERLQAQPETDAGLVALAEDAVARSATLGIARLPAGRRRAVRERAVQFKQEIARLAEARPDFRALLDDAAREMNGTQGDPGTFRRLHRLLERQAYRLAYWRVAASEINYRRFFDINDLAGVRMENPALFEVAHGFVWRLAGAGTIDGLRIDHIDGMLDPAQYCRRLAENASAPLHVVVEKILAPHESLRESWPIAGTTGYEALNLVNGLFVRPGAERALTRVYRRFAGEAVDFDRILHQCKKLVMRQILLSELEVLTHELDRLSEQSWRTRDFTASGLRAALEEIAACFPVYRTYVDGRGASAEDRRDIDWAIAVARRHAPDIDESIFDFIHAVLTADLVRQPRSGYNRRSAIRFAMKFQQFTGPVTAKSMEDTAFYRFNRLLSLNEVGGDPRRMGTSPAAFHHQMQERARRWPAAMTASATHDTKRGEDARARLNVLSELPVEWSARVARWATLNRGWKTQIEDAPAPSRNDEYLIYQILVGSWPNGLLDPERLDPEAVDAFRERVEGCLVKCLREAKQHTSWARPDPAYEDAATGFVRRLLDARHQSPFLADFIAFERQVARLGMLNSLAQLTIKLTMPGVPDIYQGTELWDYSMVDPDNRRPVDFARRRDMLDELRRSTGDRPADAAMLAEWLADWQPGWLKLYLTCRLLGLRRARPDLFNGGYLPLAAEGVHADHLCAFARTDGEDALLVVVPRFFAGLGGGDLPPAPDGEDGWGDTAVTCPSEPGWHTVEDVLTGAAWTPECIDGTTTLRPDALFAALPVAVLATREAA